MSTLSEFLEEKAREHNVEERQKRVKEWLDALISLRSNLRQWLNQADKENRFLIITDTEFDKLESGLGAYTAPGLIILFGDSEVEIIPVARNVVGGANLREDVPARFEGRVDITNGTEKYICYRAIQDHSDQWYVMDENHQFTKLDQTRFEEIMQDLLS